METDLFPDIEYSVITSEVIKSFLTVYCTKQYQV